MNQIDNKMKHLVKKIKRFSQEELVHRIKQKYQKLPIELKQSMETFFTTFPYWGSLNHQKNDFNEIENVAYLLKEKISFFEQFYEELKDYRSKKALYAILNNWFDYDFKTLPTVIESCYSHYFDLDLIPSCQNEVFVDLGAYTGDTIEEMLQIYDSSCFQTIYAYEMSEDSILELKERIGDLDQLVVRNVAIAEKIGVGSIENNVTSASANVLESGSGSLEVTTLDYDIQEKITMMKLDIEGSEVKALIGAQNHIKNDQPILMISVYHGFDDLLNIWQLIKQYNPYYSFYLRYYGGPIFPTEIVLYAIP